VIGIWYVRRAHDHEWSWYYSRPHLYLLVLAVGLTALMISLNMIDREDSDFLTASGSNEFVVDASGVAVRNLTSGESDQYTRFQVSIINTTEAPLVLRHSSG
jgi:hypothetical protein